MNHHTECQRSSSECRTSAAVPDLPVMDSGGVLQIQSHSLCTETLFQLSQSAALLAAIRLQDRMNGSETKQHKAREQTAVAAMHTFHNVTLLVKYPTSSCEVRRWILFTLQDAFSSISQNRRKLYNCSREKDKFSMFYVDVNILTLLSDSERLRLFPLFSMLT